MLYALCVILGFSAGAFLVAKIKSHSDDEFQAICKDNERLRRKIAAVQFFYKHKLSKKRKKEKK